MNHPSVFRLAPSNATLERLVALYDRGPAFGVNVSFAHMGESPVSVGALLLTYLRELPAPLLHPALYDAFWAWCVAPSFASADGGATGVHVAASVTPAASVTVAADHSTEKRQIAIARILIKLLPVPQLTLFVYLCAFFHQVTQCAGNGLTCAEIARIFAGPMLGRTGRTEGETVRMLDWILARWTKMDVETIFDAESDA